MKTEHEIMMNKVLKNKDFILKEYLKCLVFHKNILQK